MDALFGLYDRDNSGFIDYKEFTSNLFNRTVSAPQSARQSIPQSATAPQVASNTEDLIDRLRNKLAARGARGIIGIGKQFRIMDDNNSRSLDLYEFTKAMKDYMLGFSDTEIRALYNYFDYDRCGSINYDEFLRTLRGPLNAGRKKLIA